MKESDKSLKEFNKTTRCGGRQMVIGSVEISARLCGDGYISQNALSSTCKASFLFILEILAMDAHYR